MTRKNRGRKVKINLNKNERLDDLQRDGLMIIQDSTKYCFSLDSVLLSDFVKIEEQDACLELCSGCGVISILAGAKYKPQSIDGLELDPALCDMSKRSLEYNGINNISFFNVDITKDNDVKEALGSKKYDVIFANPPYLKPLKDMSRVSAKFHSTKFETTLKLSDVLSISRQRLKKTGRLYLIYPSPRMQEVLSSAKEFGLYLATLQNVFFKQSANSALFMSEFVLNKTDCNVIAPIVLNG